MPEIRHLRCFVAVAEALNFSRAAERLHMAQPPLSVAIRQLEQELGAQLLMRTTRQVKLTGVGEVFLEGARRTLADLEHSVADARQAASGALGSLRVAFSWSAQFETLPALGRAFSASYPDVELLTEAMWNVRMPNALRSATIDVALAICPEIGDELAYEPIRHERLVALVASTHRLASESQLDLAALADDAFVLFPRPLAPRAYDFVIGQCRRAGFEPRVRSESFHTCWDIGTLADIDAVSIVPESVARELPAGVEARQLEGPVDEFETALLWRKGETSAVATAFREIARAYFPSSSEPSTRMSSSVAA
jgi:DNA-binding transcriptional LysR family regulator